MTLQPGPLTRVTQGVRSGELLASRVVATSIDRLAAAESTLNVLAERAYDDALRQAELLDDIEARPGLLVGAPTLIKDLEDWRGHPTRKGSLALADAPSATSNGVVAQRLIDAGAIIVGKSTLPEFAIEGFTANHLSGITRNPWNPELSPGGSSGGSGAALSAGLVLVATATDGGGSIRIPASLCGLLGLKPTNGMIGRWPAPDWMDYSTDGPLATAADDLRLLYDVMIGPVAGDPTSPPRALHDRMARFDASSLTLYAAERTSPFGPLPESVGQAFHAAVEAVSSLFGQSVNWREPEDFFPVGDPDLEWYRVCPAEHVASLGREWVQTHMDEFHITTQEFLTAGLNVSIDEYLSARRRRYLYIRIIDELLGENGLLLTPTVASEGFLADGRLTSDAELHGMPPAIFPTVLQNITGHPALCVPFGVLPSGLPFGLQITAPHYHDYRLLDLAARLEEAFPWPRCAPGYRTLADTLGLE